MAVAVNEFIQNTTLNSPLTQWFPNFLACDPKEKLDVSPGPKLVKTADLQAHNAARSDVLCACRSSVFTSLGPGQMSNFSFGSRAKKFGNH